MQVTNHAKENFVGQQNNIALVSALLLTIQFSLFYDLAKGEYDFRKILKNLGVSNASQTTADWCLDINWFFCLFCITVTCMAMIQSILLLLVVSEMNDNELKDY